MQTQTSLSSQLSVRERGLTTAILGLGFITFAIDASNTTLILPQIMTNLRVEVYQIHWILTAPGIVRLATLEALPENKVYMATALSGLLRSIANAVGTAVAAVVWDQRYNYHLQHFAEETPLDSFGFAGALSSLQHTLQWSGEIAALIPTKSMALIRDRLFAEASTAAWQDFFWFNALVAIVCLFPALPFWRRRKYLAPSTSQTATVSVQSGAMSKGDPKS